MKRERWLEDDVLALPAEESDAFERKSGRLYDDMNRFLDNLAKALFAFSNTGGGTLIIGVADDGMLDGLPSSSGEAALGTGSSKKSRRS